MKSPPRTSTQAGATWPSQGATTIWELWNGDTANPAMNSGNHLMLVGDLVTWLYENLAGIRPDPAQPGFKHIIMHPTPVGDLTYVKASHKSPYGEIASGWKRDGDRFTWNVTLPVNTTATVYVPASDAASVKESDRPAGRITGHQVSAHGSRIRPFTKSVRVRIDLSLPCRAEPPPGAGLALPECGKPGRGVNAA